MATENRIDWIDIAKGLAIISVVAGHSFSLGAMAPLYAFHLPVFFFLTGLVTDFGRYDIGEFVRRKGTGILMPYGIMLIVGYLVCLAIPQWRPGLTAGNIAADMYLGNPVNLQNSSLWYLPCLFVSLLFGFGLDRCVGRLKWRNWLLLAYILILPFCLLPFVKWCACPAGRLPLKADVALIAVVFVLASNWNRKRLVLALEKMATLPMVVLLAVTVWCCARVNGWANMCSLSFGNSKVLFFPIAFGGILLTCVLAICISRLPQNFLTRMLRFYGRNCLLVFLFQGLYIRLYLWTFNRLAGTHMGYLAHNPVSHQIGVFVVTVFVMSPITVLLVQKMKCLKGRAAR